LKDEIGFTDIPSIVEKCMEKGTFIAKPTLADYLESDKETRIMASTLCTSKVGL